MHASVSAVYCSVNSINSANIVVNSVQAQCYLHLWWYLLKPRECKRSTNDFSQTSQIDSVNAMVWCETSNIYQRLYGLVQTWQLPPQSYLFLASSYIRRGITNNWRGLFVKWEKKDRQRTCVRQELPQRYRRVWDWAWVCPPPGTWWCDDGDGDVMMVMVMMMVIMLVLMVTAWSTSSKWWNKRWLIFWGHQACRGHRIERPEDFEYKMRLAILRVV